MLILWIVSAVLLFAAVILIAGNTLLVIDRYTIENRKVPKSFDGFKIVQLSDLHSKEFGRNNRRLIGKIDSIDPDIIVMTGDMVNVTDDQFNVFISTSNELAKKYKIYYIIGNHEQALKNSKLEYIYSRLKAAGVTVLDNQKVVLEKDGHKIDLYGMWYNLRYYSDQTNKSIKEDPSNKYYLTSQKISSIIGEHDPERFTILLTHNPAYFESYKKWGADLTLSGHIHGGMVRLPFIGGIYSPERTLFPKYDAGMFTDSDSKMIVSRGIGNGIIGFRFLNCPEIVEVTLKAD